MPREFNYRNYAKGKPCQVRIVGVCNHDDSTTVLAHVRMAGITGIGQKAPDLLGAWACSACHDYVDGRRKRDGVPMLDHLEGVIRTQYQLIRDGLL